MDASPESSVILASSVCICMTNCPTFALKFDPGRDLKTDTIQLDGQG